MKILYPGNHGNDFATERYIANAFCDLGHTVERLDVREHNHASIVAAAKELKPDVFLFAKGQWRGGADGDWPRAADAIVALIAEIRPHIGAAVCWLWDLMCEEFSRERWKWSQAIASAVDLFALTDGLSAARLGSVACVLRDGAPDDVDDSIPFEPIADVLFAGTLYRERSVWWDAMKQRLGSRIVHVGPNGDGFEPLDILPGELVTGPKLTKLVRSFRIVVQPPWPYFPGYASDRSVVLRAHGALLAAPEVPGYGDGLTHDHYLVTGTRPDSQANKVAEYLDRHDRGQLEAIRLAGMAHARSKTWASRVEQLLSHLGQRATSTSDTGAENSGSLADEDTVLDSSAEITHSQTPVEISSASSSDGSVT